MDIFFSVGRINHPILPLSPTRAKVKGDICSTISQDHFTPIFLSNWSTFCTDSAVTIDFFPRLVRVVKYNYAYTSYMYDVRDRNEHVEERRFEKKSFVLYVPRIYFFTFFCVKIRERTDIRSLLSKFTSELGSFSFILWHRLTKIR